MVEGTGGKEAHAAMESVGFPPGYGVSGSPLAGAGCCIFLDLGFSDIRDRDASDLATLCLLSDCNQRFAKQHLPH